MAVLALQDACHLERAALQPRPQLATGVRGGQVARESRQPPEDIPAHRVQRLSLGRDAEHLGSDPADAGGRRPSPQRFGKAARTLVRPQVHNQVGCQRSYETPEVLRLDSLPW